MKCLWLKLFLISFIWGQEAQYQRDGDPKDSSFPGGYAGISYEFDLKSKENNKVFSKKFTKETTYNSMNNIFELNQYKLNLEKNMISQILQDINIFLSVIKNDL
mgnify:CR=1 FL=1